MSSPAGKPVPIMVSLVALAAMSSVSAGQPACGPAAVRATVEVAGPEFSLADVLTPSACPALLRAAARVGVGGVPLAGSARVLEGAEVRALLQKTAPDNPSSSMAWSSGSVPERIVVRRAGVRASCFEISERILAALSARPLADQTLSPGEFECGAAGRIPQDSRLEATKMRWNPALNSWEISVRCVRPADCVPFLVRAHSHQPLPRIEGSTQSDAGTSVWPEVSRSALRLRQPSLGFEDMKPLVRAGEAATLSWDEGGIRLTVPVVCLDAGGIGQKVRVRILRGGRTMSAVVVSAGQLRAVA
jgi:hypothetical protein